MRKTRAMMLVGLLTILFSVVVYSYKDAADDEKASHQAVLRAAAKDWGGIYDVAGKATVRIYALGKDSCFTGCHGVVTIFNNKPIILTAAHCIYCKNEIQAGVFIFPNYITEKGNGVTTGYGFLGNAVNFNIWDEKKDVIVDLSNDIALIRIDDAPEVRTKAVEVARNAPQPNEFVYTTHWQPNCWYLGKSQDEHQSEAGRCIDGELLIPLLGISQGYKIIPLDGKAPELTAEVFTYSFAAFGGDSGSGIFDKEGRLVGLTTLVDQDKVKEGVYTYSSDLPSIRLFLHKNLGGAEEFIGGDE